jgi:hypothetical protein
LVAGVLTAGAVLVGALFHAGESDRVVPTNTTSRDVSPMRVPTAPFEDVFAWCMRGVDCPPMAVPQPSGPDHNEPRYSPAD